MQEGKIHKCLVFEMLTKKQEICIKRDKAEVSPSAFQGGSLGQRSDKWIGEIFPLLQQ
jgi:hypothetical protein